MSERFVVVADSAWRGGRPAPVPRRPRSDDLATGRPRPEEGFAVVADSGPRPDPRRPNFAPAPQQEPCSCCARLYRREVSVHFGLDRQPFAFTDGHLHRHVAA